MSDPELDEEGRPGRWFLADEPRPVRLPPFDLPAESGGFRLARIFDEPAADSRPRVDAARGRVTDVDERRRLLGYFESTPVVIETGGHSVDLLAPRRVVAVPHRHRTDGTWIWHESVAYYLRWHRIPPEPDLLAHIVASGYRVALVGEQVREAAVAAMRAADTRFAEWLRAWQVDTGQLADPARFPFEIQARLIDLAGDPGATRPTRWTPGSRRTWCACAGTASRASDYPPYEPFEAARRVFPEFGGLRSRDNGPGVTSARMPFLIFPGEHPEDRSLTMHAASVADYGKRLLQPTFQLGTVEGGMALLVIAEDGSVHLTGAVELPVGDTFDAALVAMLTGDLPEDPHGQW